VTKTLLIATLSASLLPLSVLQASPQAGYGPQLEGFEYPHPIQRFEFSSQQQDLSMGYMDVKPTGQTNGRTAVLLHGKNFCGATWEATIKALSDAGYRVIAPDQIGFAAQASRVAISSASANWPAILTHCSSRWGWRRPQ